MMPALKPFEKVDVSTENSVFVGYNVIKKGKQ